MFQFARTLCSGRRSGRWRAGTPAPTRTPRPWKRRGGSRNANLTATVRNSRRLLITQYLDNPGFVPRPVSRQRLRLLHVALGARFRGPPIEVGKIKEIFSPIPPESEEKLAIILR